MVSVMPSHACAQVEHSTIKTSHISYAFQKEALVTHQLLLP